MGKSGAIFSAIVTVMICIPIIAKRTEETSQQAMRASLLGDMIEIRLDLMDSFDLNTILSVSSKPVLATYRSQGQGGRGTDDPETRCSILLSVLRSNPDFIDVEFELPSRWRQRIIDQKGTSRVLISTHFPESTPSVGDMMRRLRQSREAGADIVKIVARAERYEDNLKVLELIPVAKEMGLEIIAFCMGPKGLMSRVYSLILGAFATFASLEKGWESASGQVPAQEMKALLERFHEH